VGAFENDDEDIYGVESMANYDTVLGDEPMDQRKKNFGWTAPKHVIGWFSLLLIFFLIYLVFKTSNKLAVKPCLSFIVSLEL